jgi:hypothetical protein
VRTLSALVPAAIEGIVRDVTLACAGDIAELRKIADHAGCEIAEAADPAGAIAAGLASARGDLLLILRAGYAPQSGFIEEIADMFQRATRPSRASSTAETHTHAQAAATYSAPLAASVSARKPHAALASVIAFGSVSSRSCVMPLIIVNMPAVAFNVFTTLAVFAFLAHSGCTKSALSRGGEYSNHSMSS